VPLVPLGFWRRWRCGVCGADPHASPHTRKGLKWAGIVVLALMSLSGWAVSTSEKPGDAVFLWAMRLGGPLAVAWAVWATLKSPPDVKLKTALRQVQPSMDVNCLVCGIPLIPDTPAWHCPRCGVRRVALVSSRMTSG
jgi:hypothetical protein